MKKEPALLQTEDLFIGYPHVSGAEGKSMKRIAGPLNLQLVPGKLICLLGANGTGKSTLIKTLAGLQSGLSGEVTIGGRSVTSLSPLKIAGCMSLVLTETVRAWNLDVYSLIALGRFPYTSWLGTLSKADRLIIGTAIQSVQLEDFIHRKVDELSDGERQRVMLGRALAQDTAIIILDEPTAHLDLPNRIALMNLLHTLSKSHGKSILLSTHELDLALQLADEIWLLDGQGNLLIESPEDLVLSGQFAAAFDKGGKLFDLATGTFNITLPKGPVIMLVGSGIPAFWTKRALQRVGFNVIILPDGGEDLLFTVTVTEVGGNLNWKLTDSKRVLNLLSVAALLEAMGI